MQTIFIFVLVWLKLCFLSVSLAMIKRNACALFTDFFFFFSRSFYISLPFSFRMCNSFARALVVWHHLFLGRRLIWAWNIYLRKNRRCFYRFFAAVVVAISCELYRIFAITWRVQPKQKLHILNKFQCQESN